MRRNQGRVYGAAGKLADRIKLEILCLYILLATQKLLQAVLLSNCSSDTILLGIQQTPPGRLATSALVLPTVPVLQINAELKSLIVSILNSLYSRKSYVLPLSPSPSK